MTSLLCVFFSTANASSRARPSPRPFTPSMSGARARTSCLLGMSPHRVGHHRYPLARPAGNEPTSQSARLVYAGGILNTARSRANVPEQQAAKIEVPEMLLATADEVIK